METVKKQIYNKIPSLYWGKNYERSWLLGDFISGLTIALILIPQSLAYVKLAELPIQYGLYSSFMGPFVYSFFSTNKNISFGPTALIALGLGSALKELVQGDVELIDVLPTLSLFISVGLLLIGLLRLGNLINLIPHPVNVGFTSAVAIIIMVSQIPNLLGVKLESGGGEGNAFGSLYEIATELKKAKMIDLILGLSSLIFLIVFKKVCKMYSQKLKYFGTLSNTICMVFFTLIVMIIDFDSKKEINIIKNIPKGINIEVPKLDNLERNLNILKRSLEVMLVVIIEHSSVSKHFNKKLVDNNQEFIAIGISNFIALFFGGVTSGGSFCRSAVQEKAGANSPVTSIITGLIVFVTLLFLTPIFYYIPYSTLSAVIIMAVFHLIASPKSLKKLWKINRIDLVICILSFLLTLALGIQVGILVSTIISFAHLLYTLSYPKYDIIEPIEDEKIEKMDLDDEKLKGIIIIRPTQSILYCNSDYLINQFIKIINNKTKPHPNIESYGWKHNKEKLNYHNEKVPYLKAVIFDFISVDNIDSSGVQALIKLKNYLSYYQHEDNYLIHFVNLNSRLKSILLNSDLVTDINLFNNYDFFDNHTDVKRSISRHVSIVMDNNIHESLSEALSSIARLNK